MKKILLTAIIAISIISSAFANPGKEVNYFVINSFREDFGNVEDVKWNITPAYAKAAFILNNVATEAFYKLDGEFIGTTQTIAIEDLPIAAKRSFAKKYSNYIVKEAIKLNGNEETAYFILAENEKHSVVLKANNAGITVYKVSSKK